MRIAIVVLVAACFVWAATPVASITSSADFQLSGANVVVAGVPSWPLSAGDSVVAGISALKIRFVDGTVVNLGPHSRIAVDRKNNDLNLRLANGYLSFTLAPDSAMRVYSGSALVAAQPGVMAIASTSPVSGSATNLIGKPPSGPPSLSQH